MKRDNVIEIHDVHLSLGSSAAKIDILRGVSLTVGRGEALALVGKSGSGKSTLLMTMAGLERPDAGRILVEGRNISEMDEDDIARFRSRRIGVIFQSFHLISSMTALENIAIPLELNGHASPFKTAMSELAAVGLQDRANHFPSQLSGGEQQRVAIARAIAPEPAILLADEPTGNLDDETGQAISALLFQLRKERQTSLVLVTHDLSLANSCDRIVHIKSGLLEPEMLPHGNL